MDVSPREQLSSSLDKGLDEIVILFSSYPTLAETKVKFIIQ
jgi:hypothetical protein